MFDEYAVTHRRSPPRKRRTRFEVRFLVVALVGGLPPVLALAIILWAGDYTPQTRWTVTGLAVACWLGSAFYLRSYLVYPLRTLSNLLSALREEDYSLRGRGARTDDSLGEVMLEVNALGDALRG